MARHDTYINVRNVKGPSLEFKVFEEGVSILTYIVSPRRVYGSKVLFVLHDVVRQRIDTSGMDYILAMGSMYKIASTDISVFDRLAVYKPNDVIGFGIVSKDAPYAFTDNDAFTESLLMENLICDEEEDPIYFNIISGRTPDVIEFDLSELQYLVNGLIDIADIPIFFNN